ncbi:hypothetical protein R1sor_025820 [Riccia sorocarpa]|uniref:Uncharacterized protein n=1 Tax=Riccia sorocarpa TaxID=122646 RepID=A0ABD3G9P3_9MARC
MYRRVREGNGYRVDLEGMYLKPPTFAWFKFPRGTIFDLPPLEEDYVLYERNELVHRAFYLPPEFDLNNDLTILRADGGALVSEEQLQCLPGTEKGIRLAIATRLAAKYGTVSVQHQNAERRVEIRREKNVMVTNPFGHQGFAGFRARFVKKGIRYVSLAEAYYFCTSSLHKMSLSVHGERTDISESEVAGPSNAEAGEDSVADDDFAAAAAAVAGTGDGVDDDALTDFSEGLSGAELEEDEHGLIPEQEQHAESGGDDEDDTPLAARSVVPESSAARTTVTQPLARQTRAHIQSASTQGTEGRKKKSKKSMT